MISTLRTPSRNFLNLSFIDLELARDPFSRENQKRRPSTVSAFSQHFKKNPVSFGLIGFFVLKVVFVDIFIAFGDVFSDFWQVKMKYVLVKALSLSVIVRHSKV